ncbi:BnaC07g31910D [Brassica napus]|uniref:BnaC07g31910D protein n=1 Tax=Brassica napus TaxID=3708 RepID=A0A078GR23_BRANA|nr:BnaC07g31910D [Brassica napus]
MNIGFTWVLVCFYSLFASSVLCSRSARGYEFGRTYVVRPKGKHQATIVWLHGLGDNGSSSSQLLESLPLPNVRIHNHKHLEVIFCFPCNACKIIQLLGFSNTFSNKF